MYAYKNDALQFKCCIHRSHRHKKIPGELSYKKRGMLVGNSGKKPYKVPRSGVVGVA